MPIRYQKYSVVADTDVCWLLQSYKQNPIQEGREGFEYFPFSLVLQFVDVRKQFSALISLITFSRFLYSEASEKSQTKWPLQQLGTFAAITNICIYMHTVSWASSSRHWELFLLLFFFFFLLLPHYQCNGVCKAVQPAACGSTSVEGKKPQLFYSHCKDCSGSSLPKT